VRRVALTTTALVASFTLVAAPAFAAEPVAYALAWTSTTLYQLEPGTDAVEVDATTGIGAVTGLDFDADGNGYAITYGGQSRLWAVDITGEATLIGDIFDADGAEAFDCTALDYTGGVISVACDSVGDDVDVFGTIDPTSAVFTAVQALSTRVASLAFNPTNGVMYGFGYGGSVLSIGDGVSEVGTTPDNVTLYGADFDDAGALWATADTTATALLNWDLVAFPNNDGNGDFIENISVFAAAAEEPVVVDEPELALADTGLSDGNLVLVGIAGALVLLSGLALAMVARRAARRS